MNIKNGKRIKPIGRDKYPSVKAQNVTLIESITKKAFYASSAVVHIQGLISTFGQKRNTRAEKEKMGLVGMSIV